MQKNRNYHSLVKECPPPLSDLISCIMSKFTLMITHLGASSMRLYYTWNLTSTPSGPMHVQSKKLCVFILLKVITTLFTEGHYKVALCRQM